MDKGQRLVVVITGTSSGIGRACAEYFTKIGHVVYGLSRSKPRGVKIWTSLICDVGDSNQVVDSFESIIAEEGRVDVLINNAGHGLAGAVETAMEGDINEIFSVNFNGAVFAAQAVLPSMIKHNFGYIINIASVAAEVPMPFRSFYCASKAALAKWSECLRLEVASDGVRVATIHPGHFKTNFKRNEVEPAYTDLANEKALCRFLEWMTQKVDSGNDPIKVAELAVRIVNDPKPRHSYYIGSLLEIFAAYLKRIMPQRWFERLLRRYYGI